MFLETNLQRGPEQHITEVQLSFSFMKKMNNYGKQEQSKVLKMLTNNH